MDRKGQTSQDFSGGVNIPVDDTIEASNGLSELDAIKLEMKMMQQRIKSVEDSRSTGGWSPTVSSSTQISRRPSSTIDEAPTLRKGAPSNGSIFSITQTPTSAHYDGVFTPRTLGPKRHVAVDRCNSSSTPVDFKPEAMPPRKLFTTKSRTATNGTISRGRHGPISMPPPQKPSKPPKQEDIHRRRNSCSIDMTTPRTASTPTTASTNSISLPRPKSQEQEAPKDSHHSNPESHIYDDELDDNDDNDDDEVRPHSSTSSFTRNSQQPAAHSRQTQKNESIQQRLPSKPQRRKSVSMAPPVAKASNNEIKRSTSSHRESKRRKTNASIWTADGSREVRSTGGRGGGQGLFVRIDSQRC